MTTLEEVRKSIEAVIGNLTPAKAQELAKSLSDPGTAKEQVSKLAADMLVWSQRSRERLKEFVSREVSSQMNSVGVATQADLDAVKKRVRDLERRAGMTASGRRTSGRKSTAKKSTAKKPTAKKTAAKPTPAASLGIGRVPRRRLDAELVRRGLASSRAEAQAVVAEGRVTVAGNPATKAVLARGRRRAGARDRPARRYVSRGGEKLRGGARSVRRSIRAAATAWTPAPRPGGFTDCLLQAGAARVVARRRRLRPARVGAPQRPAGHRAASGRTSATSSPATCRSLPALVVADLSFISLARSCRRS